MRGVVRYAPDPTVAILDSTRAGETYEGIPIVARVADSLCFGPTTAIVGVAPTGGVLPPVWRELLETSISQRARRRGRACTSFLADDPELADAARRHGVELRDLRRPPEGLGVPTGENLRHRADGRPHRRLGLRDRQEDDGARARPRGAPPRAPLVFVPTGQTGIAIAGWGIAVDAVVSDFVAGAAERLVVEGAARGDLLWVEGQGSLVHPVLLGRHARPLPRQHAPSARALPQGRRHAHRGAARAPDPAAPAIWSSSTSGLRCPPVRPRSAAIALNTMNLAEEAAARRAIAEAEASRQLVADDPVRFGAGRLVDAVLERLPARR